MTYRLLFINILMSMLCCFYSSTVTMGANPMGMDFDLESLEEANRAIEEYVASLSPEEQADFNRQVEEMAQMFSDIENMSEDEFEKLLGEIFANEPMAESNPFEISLPEEQEVVEVVLTADEKRKVETAVKIIDDIINQTNLFIVIVNSSPELPNRITRWATKGDIANWQNEADWDKFKKELEVFVQTLYKTLEQDLATKKYKYILDVIADEGLYNNLIQLQTELNSLVPTINIPEFNVQKLSTESRTAIKSILNKYTEALYLLAIPQAIDKIFQKYGPEAEKIRAAEEAATRQALETQKRGRTPAAKTEAGIESEMGYGYEPSYYGGDYGYSPYDYGSYGGDYGYSPDYGYGGYDSGYETGASRGGRGGGGGEEGRGAAGGGEGKEAETEEGKDKKRKKGKEPAKFALNYKIERAIADIKSGISDIVAAMTPAEEEEAEERTATPPTPTSLGDIAATIDKPDIDILFAGSILPMVDKKLTTIDEAIKKISGEKLNADDLAHYQQEVQNAFPKNNEKLKNLRDQIDKFELPKTEEEKEAIKKPGSTKINVAGLPDEKKWAYFAEGTLISNDENDKLKEQIGTPTSLFEIKGKIDTLFKDIEKFATKRAAPVKPEPVKEAVEVAE